MPESRIITYGEAVREALAESMRRDPTVFLLGEGVADPSGVFGTTKGLLDEFGPERMVEMPVSEGAMFGVAIGAAMTSHRPVINLHRVEFAMLALEQLFNNAAKMHYTTNGQHKVPLVVRVVVGRGWGQGPQHSQSLESVFAHFPGLKVVMPTLACDAKGMLIAAVEDDNPVVVIEHRWLHGISGPVAEGYQSEPLRGGRVLRAGEDITIVATSYMALASLHAAKALNQAGVSAEVVDLRVLRPLDLEVVLRSVEKTGRLLTVDSGWTLYGVGAEIIARIAEHCFSDLKAPPRRLGLKDHPTPSSRSLVVDYYPTPESIVDAVGTMLDAGERTLRPAVQALAEARKNHNVDQPDPSFRGPF